jgi:2-polyprenyl-3-methyl-5-hydroxy-6-metoxy-1,4-benzoquinol methylase
MSDINHQRPEITSAELEAKELEWWQEFAELEDRFAWVQTPAIQRILRGRYVREIVKYAGADGRIIELGCGVGWLCFVLADSGAKEVFGVDFSAAQIAIAQDRAEAAGLTGRVHFRCADGTQDTISTELYDCVVVHGFLHHLNKSEIRRTMASVPKLLKPNGAFIVFEPVRREGKLKQAIPMKLKWQRFLAQLANRGQRYGIRRVSQEEKRWRELFARRNWGLPPHGPSPKEMPFAPGELETYLIPHFVIECQHACMANSHLVIQDWLLRELTYPNTTRWLLPWIARAAAWMDRGLIRQIEPVPDSWILNMWVCRPHVGHD